MKQMAPLFLQRHPLRPPIFKAIEERLGEYFSAGALGSTDVHVVARLIARVWPDIEARGGSVSPSAALALALSVRAPSHAHICVDLSEITVDEFQEQRGTRPESVRGTLLALPEESAMDPQCGGVNRAGSHSRRCTQHTFVLDGTWLCTDRYWRYQKAIVERVSGGLLCHLLHGPGTAGWAGPSVSSTRTD